MMRAVAFLLILFLIPNFAYANANMLAEAVKSVCVVIVNPSTLIIDKDKNFIEEYKDYEKKKSSAGQGTCFVTDINGTKYIITNNHVVAQANNPNDIKISFFNEYKEFVATIVNSDQESDVAVLSIDKTKLERIPALEWANSKTIRRGDTVYAIGHPIGQQYSVSKGIVSNESTRPYNVWQELIQTDAAINQGNSGGPLLNESGKVVGINTLIISPFQSGNIGLGYSLTSRIAQYTIKTLLERESIIRPGIGISYIGDPETGKIKVIKVFPGSPGDQAGLMINDFIIKIESKTIQTINDIREVIDFMEPDDFLTILIERSGDVYNLTVKLGKASDFTR